MRKSLKHLILFAFGTIAYFEIELNWRYAVGHLPVHWSMAALGGILFLILGGINEKIGWDMPLLCQCLLGAAIVTCAEFLTGVTLNIILKLEVWDYSNMPLNLMGQICLPFSLVWILISGVAIVADDWLRHWLFGEEKPHYTWKLKHGGERNELCTSDHDRWRN